MTVIIPEQIALALTLNAELFFWTHSFPFVSCGPFGSISDSGDIDGFPLCWTKSRPRKTSAPGTSVKFLLRLAHLNRAGIHPRHTWSQQLFPLISSSFFHQRLCQAEKAVAGMDAQKEKSPKQSARVYSRWRRKGLKVFSCNKCNTTFHFTLFTISSSRQVSTDNLSVGAARGPNGACFDQDGSVSC